MYQKAKKTIYRTVKYTERFTKTDMIFLVKAGFWTSATKIIVTASSILLSVALANLLTQQDYGIYKYLISIVGLLSTFTLSGLNSALIPAIAQGYEKSYKIGYKLQLKWSLLASLISGGIGTYYLVQGNSNLAIAFFLMAVFYPLYTAPEINAAYVIGKKLFKLSAKISSFNKIILTAALLITAYFWPEKPYLLFIVFFLTPVITRNSWHFWIRKKINTETKHDPDVNRYAKHLSLMNIISSISAQIDSVIIFQFLSPAQLAIYSFAINLPEQIRGLIYDLVPISVAKFAQRSISDIKKNIYNRMAFLFGLILFLVLLYIITAPTIFRLLFPQYMDAVALSQIYSLSIIVLFAVPIKPILQAHRKIKDLHIVNNLSSMLYIIALIFGVYFYGLPGAIAAKMLQKAFTSLIMLIRFIKIPSDEIKLNQ